MNILCIFKRTFQTPLCHRPGGTPYPLEKQVQKIVPGENLVSNLVPAGNWPIPTEKLKFLVSLVYYYAEKNYHPHWILKEKTIEFEFPSQTNLRFCYPHWILYITFYPYWQRIPTGALRQGCNDKIYDSWNNVSKNLAPNTTKHKLFFG